jgi:hypothetical protein
MRTVHREEEKWVERFPNKAIVYSKKYVRKVFNTYAIFLV